jgi:predicted dehydrogenase
MTDLGNFVQKLEHLERVYSACESTPSAAAVPDIRQALEREDVDAVVIATPGFLHKEILLQVLERGLPILCKKPLTPDAASSWEIVETEQRFGKKCIQVNAQFGYRTMRLRPKELLPRLWKRSRLADWSPCRESE